MLKFRILIISLLIASQSLYSQISIQISVKQSHSKLAKLYYCQQAEAKLVDSSKQITPGVFKFNLPINHEQGLYRFAIGKNIDFDFVVANEPQITLETVVFAAEDSVRSTESKENEVYFQYKKVKKRLSQQAWFLNSLIDYYSDSSIFHKQINYELYKVHAELYNASKRLTVNNPNLFTSNLIRLELKPTPDIGQTPKARNSFLKENWWVEANLRDIRFANSIALDSKLWAFIELFINEGYDKEQQDSSFVAAAKSVLNLNADPTIKDYFRRILFKNYLDSDYDVVTKYLFETSFDGLPSIALTVEERNTYEIQSKNGVGTNAKDFNLNIYDGTKQKLSKIRAPYKLIIFWSMWCPHCTEMLPELYKTYQDYKLKGLEVVAICIDDELEGWKRFVAEKNQGWINAIEPDNGENKIIMEYNVDGTPELFLLDKNLTIISRPSNINQLDAKLRMLLK